MCSGKPFAQMNGLRDFLDRLEYVCRDMTEHEYGVSKAATRLFMLSSARERKVELALDGGVGDF